MMPTNQGWHQRNTQKMQLFLNVTDATTCAKNELTISLKRLKISMIKIIRLMPNVERVVPLLRSLHVNSSDCYFLSTFISHKQLNDAKKKSIDMVSSFLRHCKWFKDNHSMLS